MEAAIPPGFTLANRQYFADFEEGIRFLKENCNDCTKEDYCQIQEDLCSAMGNYCPYWNSALNRVRTQERAPYLEQEKIICTDKADKITTSTLDDF